MCFWLLFPSNPHLDVLHIDNHNILWYIKIIQLFVHCPKGFPDTFRIAHVVKFVLEEHYAPV